MQPRYAPPDRDLADDDLYKLITTPRVQVGAGLELLDRNLTVLADLTSNLVPAGSSVKRGNYDTIHGTCDLIIDTELDWGRAILRPFMTLSTAGPLGVTARFNLGAYFTSTPDYELEESPRQYQVQGYDQLEALNTGVPDTYVVDTGTAYVQAVANILDAQGFTRYQIDQTAGDVYVTLPRVWPLNEQTTWLGIVNDLLAAVGYRGLWVDWDGVLRAEPYTPPYARPPEWVYDTSRQRTILRQRKFEFEYFDTPNQWVAVRSNNEEGASPTEGDGVYTYTNEDVGPASVERRGRVITKVLPFEAASQDALIAQANQVIFSDISIDVKFAVSTGPNPLHWHFDRVDLADEAIGAPLSLQSSSWTLPLDGSDMSHEWAGI